MAGGAPSRPTLGIECERILHRGPTDRPGAWTEALRVDQSCLTCVGFSVQLKPERVAP